MHHIQAWGLRQHNLQSKILKNDVMEVPQEVEYGETSPKVHSYFEEHRKLELSNAEKQLLAFLDLF